MTGDTRLRVGRIAALNMFPLYHHLERAEGHRFRFTDGVPTALNRALLADRLDVSAMSSIEFARNAEELRLLPVASVSAAGAVDSIQLFSATPPETVTRVAVTPHSATSVALLRVLLGPAPEFVPLEGRAGEALAAGDAVLLIGDEALEGRLRGLAPYATDLGALWRARTGVPMVFAVWALRRDVDPARAVHVARLEELLREARRRYAADPAEVVDAATARFPFPRDFIAAYFRRLSYGFGDRERAGLARFLELARGAGELTRLPALAA
ncbi:MAG TPA: menaquinone biosynthesis protein [Miltoncostaeaceae bacterium]|nr:menaquinone biosynthesis protein [Miltoncostaeaceae bacterium]